MTGWKDSHFFSSNQTQNHDPRNQNQTQSRPCYGLHRADRLPRHRILRQIHSCNYHQLNPKTMHKFEVINWSQCMKACEIFPSCDTMQEAMANCKHQTPYLPQPQTFEEFSEVTELDQHGNLVQTYYFVTL